LHPDGRSLVVLVRTRATPGHDPVFAWVVVPEGGPPGPLHPIEGADVSSTARIARGGDAGIVVIQLNNLLGGGELLALGVSPDGLAPLYRVPVSRHLVLAQDARGRKLYAVECPLRRLAVAELGTTPPELPFWSL